MNPDVLTWRPVLSPITTLLIVVLGVFAQNRHVDTRIADISARFSAELRAAIAELRAELKPDIQRLEDKIDHIAEVQATQSERLDRLERR